MCLETIEKQYNKTSNRIHVGYKKFKTCPGNKLKFEYFSLYAAGIPATKIVPLGIWFKATRVPGLLDGRIRTESGESYEPGFHIYKTEEDLKASGKEKPTKVFFRNVTARGTEPRGLWREYKAPKVLIAQEMFVPSFEGEVPPELRKKKVKKGKAKK